MTSAQQLVDMYRFGVAWSQPDSRFAPDPVAGANSVELPRWRLALAKVLSGQANARVLFPGDSTTFGVGSNNANGRGGGDMNAQSYPTQLATRLTAVGITANAHGWMGDGSSVYETRHTNDGRLVMGSSWTQFAGTPSLGGQFFTASTNTNALAFTPAAPVDTFKIWFVQGTGNGVMGLDINGTGATTANTGVTPNQIGSATIAGTLGTNTLNIKWSSGGAVYVVGVEAFNSAVKSVNLINAGWSGAKVSDLSGASQPYGALPSIPLFAPDLSIIDIGINDWLLGTTPTTYQTSLQNLVTQCLITGDVILVTPAPSAIATTSKAIQQSFINAMYAVAAAKNVPVIDNWARWNSQEANLQMYAQNGAGPGNVHPNMIGYSDAARSISKVLHAA